MKNDVASFFEKMSVRPTRNTKVVLFYVYDVAIFSFNPLE